MSLEKKDEFEEKVGLMRQAVEKTVSKFTDEKIVDNFIKYDKDKPMFGLIPTQPLQQLAEVYTMGAKKYSPHNWRKGCEWSRIYDAVQRHLTAYWGGEDLDKESGLPHLAHAAWGCFTLLEFSNKNLGSDDRGDKLNA